MLTDKDRQEIEKFRTDLVATQRELRHVKRELRKDIDKLDGVLKFVNIAAVPLLIGLAGVGWAPIGAAARRCRPSRVRSRERGPAMTPKSFVNLAGIAAASALLALVTFAAGNQWGSGKTPGEKLVPTLADTIRQVTGLEIRQGEEAVTLERAQNGTWSLKSRSGYPVDVTKVRALLVGLGQAELIEPKTSKPDRYAALELEDPEQKGAKSRLLRLTGADGKAISEVVLGKRRPAARLGTGKPAAPTCASRATRRRGSPTWSSTHRWPPRTG